MLKREIEIMEIFDRLDSTIKDRLVKDLIECYSKALGEIERRNLAEINSLEYPRYSYFFKSLFFYLYEKLHKGDKREANKLIAELQVLPPLNLNIDSYRDKKLIKDDTFYAQEEFISVLNRYSEVLNEAVKGLIIDSYTRATAEINSKNLAQRSKYPPPSIEKFIKIVFSYVFTKLHKGDQSRAREIVLDELTKLNDEQALK